MRKKNLHPGKEEKKTGKKKAKGIDLPKSNEAEKRGKMKNEMKNGRDGARPLRTESASGSPCPISFIEFNVKLVQ